jgi:hypothetical protein
MGYVTSLLLAQGRKRLVRGLPFAAVDRPLEGQGARHYLCEHHEFRLNLREKE